MIDKLNLDSELVFMEIKKTEDEIIFEESDIQYIQLFPLTYMATLIDSDLNLNNQGFSDLFIAERLLSYSVNDDV